MRLPILAVLFCATCAPARPGEPQYHAWRAVAAGEGRSAAPASSPLALVLRQVDAFNAHDADAFAAACADDAEQRVLGPRDSVEIRGRRGFRDRAAALFRRAPALRVEVLSRLEAGPYVVLHERATGTPDGRVSDAVYTYEVQGDLITRVWRTRRVPGDPAAGGRVDATTADDLVAT